MCVERYISRAHKLRLMAGEVSGWITRHNRKDYIIACVLSAPLWVKRGDFAALRAEAIRKTQETGIPHVLDHIVPVSHPHVCGLTVPWNMQVVPYSVNAAKGNKWHPDQLALFEEVEA